MNIRKNNGITLISLVITIIILIILAGVTLSLVLGQNGLLNKAKQAGEGYGEAQAKEKLELVLLDLQGDKATNSTYNQEEYIDDRLNENSIEIEGDIAIVDGWQFEIDRSVPTIARALGKLTEEELLKPAIIKMETEVTETEVKVTVQLRKAEGVTLTYILKDAETSQEIAKIDNTTDLQHTFSDLELESRKTYEIVVQASNEYGNAERTKTVTAKYNPVITLNPTSIKLFREETIQVTYTLEPSSTEEPKLIWTSSRNEIATVEDGLITAVSVGECDITCKLENGDNIATCKVTVDGEGIHLYNEGFAYTSVTSGWENVGGRYYNTKGSYAKLNDEGYIEFYYGGYIATTLHNIDINKYKYLNIELEATTIRSPNWNGFYVRFHDELGRYTNEGAWDGYSKNIEMLPTGDHTTFQRKTISVSIEEVPNTTKAISLYAGEDRDYKVYSISLSN